MKDLLHPISLVVAVLGSLVLLRDVPARRRDPASLALVSVFLLSALSFAFSITPMWTGIDRLLGTVNLAVPLAQGCVVGLFACQMVVLSYWAAPPQRARRQSLWWLAGGLAVILVLLVLFALLTPSKERPTDFTVYYAHTPIYAAYMGVYIAAYTVAEVFLAVACWRLARRPARPAVCVGLYLVAVGAVVTLGYSVIRIGDVIAGAFGSTLAGWEPLVWICGDVGTILTLVGFLVPTVNDQAQRHLLRVRQVRTYRRLRPLWLAFYGAIPEIALPLGRSDRVGQLRVRRIGIHLHRRAVEIRDGRLAVHPYLAEDVREASESRHHAAGLRDDALDAAVTADQIRAALAARATKTRPGRHTDFADAHRQALRPTEDFDALAAVSRHFNEATRHER